MEEKISDRISQLVATFGKGRNTLFAELIGDSEANIRNYRTGRSTPKYAVLLNIINKCGVNAEWLMSGVGSMTSGGSEERSQGSLTERRAPSNPTPRRMAVPKSIGVYEDPSTFEMRLPDFDEADVYEEDEDDDDDFEGGISLPIEEDDFPVKPSPICDAHREVSGVDDKQADGNSKDDEIAKLRAEVANSYKYSSELFSLVGKLNQEVNSLKDRVRLLETVNKAKKMHEELEEYMQKLKEKGKLKE